ncbi:hypothetical protein AUP68_11472 [Ilyonectria robusta]
MSTIAPKTVLPDSTVVFSNGTKRIDQRDISDQKKIALIQQLGVLKKMIRSNPDKFR